MALLTIAAQQEGMHPSEALVILDTRDGREEVFVDKSLLRDNRLEVDHPVGRENGHLLVELPRETMRGHWRVWVETNLVGA